MRFRVDGPARKRPDLVPVDLAPARARAQDAWRRGRALDAQGLAWLDRAHRLAPSDQNICFSLAAARLRNGDHDGAAILFAAMAHRFGVPECWAGLAAAHLAADRVAEAEAALRRALSTTATSATLADLAGRVVRRTGGPGWCGVRPDGTVLSDPRADTLDLTLDGQPASAAILPDGTARLPDAWHHATLLAASIGGAPLLGSPVELDVLRRVEGCVTRDGVHLSGHAWLPACPGEDPLLRVLAVDGGQEKELVRLHAIDVMPQVEGNVPLARPRAFSCTVPACATVRVLGQDGRDLLGSPLPPDGPAAIAPAKPPTVPRTPDVGLAVDVVIPVYRGLRATLACVESVLATVAPPHLVWVVDDGSPDPALMANLAAWAAEGRIGLLRTGPPGAANQGFPAAVNVGLRAAAGRHVILLNSDTLVAPGWLDSLRAAACSHPDIGTATPLSNEASIFSYPVRDGGNPAPDLAATRTLAALAASANAGRLVDVPTAHGFCMFIRADCLTETGLFDAVTFAQGYGEENDFSERARALGWRHVAVPAVYVAHVGGVSFGGARADLLARNLGLVERRYPDYRTRVAAHVHADPLAPARRRLDAARWHAREAAPASVLLITHGGGGGTARVVAERADAVRLQGLAPVVLRAADGMCEVGDPSGGFPNLAFALPREMGALLRLVQAGRPDHAELHHLLGHDHSVLRLLAGLALPYDVWVHDYGWFCARLSFVTGEGRFCGEADTATCDACVARWGRLIDDRVPPASLRRRSAADFRHARSVIVPSEDVARRVARHVPGLMPIVRPWETDPAGLRAAVLPRTGPLRVAVVGAIGLEKGFAILLACARDAAARGLDLAFIVIGYTEDDDALLATGRVFITGEFTRAEAVGLIRAQGAHLAFLPSVWPETWCYALSDIWAAGLSAAVLDIGTPAARVRATGGGWVLPLSLPPARLNDSLLELARTG